MALRGPRAATLAAVLVAGAAGAQTAALPQPQPPPEIAAPSAALADVTTLGEVRALKPEDDQPLDLYRFRNPVQASPNRFSRSWSEAPTPEQVSLSGGYLMMGINYGLSKAAQGLHKLSGGPDQIQPAIARPPPALSADQQRRAQQFCAQGDCAAPAGK